MKKLTRLLALLLTAVMAMSALCVSSSAADSDYISFLSFVDKYETEYKKTYACYSGFTSAAGKNYKSYAQMYDAYYSANTSYNLDKKFTKFEGVIACGSDNGSNYHSGSAVKLGLYIYGDDKRLYALEGITPTSGDTKFSVDVTGVKKLTIKSGAYGSSDRCFVFLGNAKVYKNSLKLNESEIKLNAKESFTIIPTYKNGANKKISGKFTYTSDDKNIAKVSSKGKVVGVAAGVTNIKVSTAGGLTEKLKVVVKPGAVTGVELLSATSESLQIKWDKLGAAKSYEIWMYDEDLEEYDKIKTVKNDTNVLIKGLESGKSYKIKIRATIKDGTKSYAGDYSKEYTFKTK